VPLKAEHPAVTFDRFHHVAAPRNDPHPSPWISDGLVVEALAFDLARFHQLVEEAARLDGDRLQGTLGVPIVADQIGQVLVQGAPCHDGECLATIANPEDGHSARALAQDRALDLPTVGGHDLGPLV